MRPFLVSCAVIVQAVIVQAGEVAQTPPLRLMRCAADDATGLASWQDRARLTLGVLLNMDDQHASARADLKPAVLETEAKGAYIRQLVELDARSDRRIKVVVTIPAGGVGGKCPAVVCIHGHGGNRDVVYDEKSVYHGFAKTLAEHGFVTLSTDVGQHDVQDPQRSLMGERLWDLMRVVDYAQTRPEVNPARIGCAGLSLGGEMAMWLGAMDTRIAATVSSGFLTTMENMRRGHCMCWDFPGLQRRYEFADIYSLIAPRPLQCQNGKLERLPGGFPVDLAEAALADIQQAYRAAGQATSVQLAVHEQGHVFDVPSGVAFLESALK